MAWLGIDIGGSSVKAALLDGGRVLWTGSSGRYERPGAEELSGAVRAALASGEGAGVLRAGSVGVCAPGRREAGSDVVLASMNVPGLVGRSVRGLVRSAVPELRADAVVYGDAHGAAYDVWRERGYGGRVLGVSLGTGIGGCVLDSGVSLRVSGESPGHLGQVDVMIEDPAAAPAGPDGGRGSAEAYLGLAALRARYGQGIEAAVAAWRGDEPPLRALARLIRIGHAIYRPQHVVLLGGLGIRLGHVVGAIRERVGEGLTAVADPGWTLETGRWDYHAACGAARLAGEPRPA